MSRFCVQSQQHFSEEEQIQVKLSCPGSYVRDLLNPSNIQACVTRTLAGCSMYQAPVTSPAPTIHEQCSTTCLRMHVQSKLIQPPIKSTLCWDLQHCPATPVHRLAIPLARPDIPLEGGHLALDRAVLRCEIGRVVREELFQLGNVL